MSNIESELRAFTIWWLAAGDKPRATGTAREYCRHLRWFFKWQHDEHGRTELAITMRDARAYLAQLRERSRWQSFMAGRALKQWSRFCADDGITDSETLAGLKFEKEPPTSHTPVAELDAIDKVLETCDSDSFSDVRDRAMILLLRDTGMRRGELVQLEYRDLDFIANTVTLRHEITKTGRSRVVAFADDTRRALRIYLRRLDLVADTDPIWRSQRGVIKPGSVSHILKQRSALAGVEVTAHSFRRSLAVRWLRSKQSETLLMSVTGWRNQRMVARYTASVAAEEALDAQRALQDAEAAQRRRAGHGGVAMRRAS